ncbi:hypothetical protein KM043_015556 [Ampulex compressa]|nr:hypothetical protein KM043_015556 [Ampulex compressa]
MISNKSFLIISLNKNMFSPVQIKHEGTGVEDINSSGGINSSDNTKYPVFINQDVEYRYRQMPQFWDHAQLSNEIPPKSEIPDRESTFQVEETGSLMYVKEYVQNGILFQVNQQQNGPNTSIQVNEQCHQGISQESERLQLPSDVEVPRPITQMLSAVQSTSVKQTRPGRPPKGSSDSTTGKKLKCQCEICFKEFGHKSNLFIHMRTHNGERPYKCNQCEKCFTHSGNLAIHMRTHSGERPYGCQICGKMFSHSGNLSTHLRTHSGVKPYKCGVCAKEFRHSGNLSIHERIHSGIKPFQCKICGKDFYHSGNLTTHVKKHSINMNTSVNESENNVRQGLNAARAMNDIPPLNSSNNLSMAHISDIKLIHNANSVVPIKNESNDEPISNMVGIVTSTSS